MIVTCVYCRNLTVLSGISCIEIVRTYSEALKTDTEDLTLDALLYVVIFLHENLIKRLLEQLAVHKMVDTLILATIVNPNVQDTGIVLSFTHSISDETATLCVLYPEFADSLVRIGQSKIAALGVRERRTVEVKLGVVLSSPFDPVLEMLRSNLVPVYELSLEVTVDLVQIQSVSTGNKTLGLENVRAELLNVAGLTRIIACRLNSSSEVSCAFKTCNVISLPAMHAEMEILKLVKDFFGVDAVGCISLLGDFISLLYCLFHMFSGI